MLKSTVILTLVLGCYKISAQCPTNVGFEDDLCQFHLYLRGSTNAHHLTNCDDIDDKMDEALNTVILVNGNANAVGFLPKIRHEIHSFEAVNIISVDWTDTNNRYLASNIGAAGRCLADFIQTMIIALNYDLAKIHIVGFSLGAHVAGSAGNRVKNEEGQVARITGLDPARLKDSPAILTRDDANYVEVIHTDGGPFGYGIGEPLGDSDFYANNGRSQPGCSNHICCHNRAHELFAASMLNQLSGRECENKAQINLNLCKGEKEPLGNIDIAKKCQESTEGCRRAMFRVNTKRNYPFY